MTTETVDTSRGPVALHLSGEGPAILLLHANPGSHKDFAAIADELSEGHRVIAVDWPGCGDSPIPNMDNFEGAISYREFLVEILDSLSKRTGWGPFVLVGSSVGGFAALSAATRRPSLVAGLVLVAPGGFTSRNPFTVVSCWVLGRPSVARFAAGPLARLYLRRRNDVTRQALVDARAVGRDPDRRAVFASVWRSFLSPEHDLRRTPPPDVPTLLTWGRWDPVLMASVDGRRAARTLGVEIHTFGSGHEPYAEVPSAWLEVVRAFLASITDAGRWIDQPVRSTGS